MLKLVGKFFWKISNKETGRTIINWQIVYDFQITNGNIRAMLEIYLKITIKTEEH